MITYHICGKALIEPTHPMYGHWIDPEATTIQDRIIRGCKPKCPLCRKYLQAADMSATLLPPPYNDPQQRTHGYQQDDTLTKYFGAIDNL